MQTNKPILNIFVHCGTMSSAIKWPSNCALTARVFSEYSFQRQSILAFLIAAVEKSFRFYLVKFSDNFGVNLVIFRVCTVKPNLLLVDVGPKKPVVLRFYRKLYNAKRGNLSN